MTPFVCAGAGFLLAVLWFDLMFDVQIARAGKAGRGEEAVGSIATYYRRVTTTARPMNRLIAAVMVATVGSIVIQLARGDRPRWVGWVALVLAGGAVLLAGVRTVPRAVQLGTRNDPFPRQHQLAKSIYRDHLLCAGAILAVLAVELGFA
jgi:hypothetical protein